MDEYISKLFIKDVQKASNGKEHIYYACTRFKLTKDGLHINWNSH